MTKRYILTGMPGSGKTSIIHALEALGQTVVYEAATDVIATEQTLGNLEPWTSPKFIDDIAALQKKRLITTDNLAQDTQFYDRSPICTYALAIYLGFEPSESLINEIEYIQKNKVYEKPVFFIANLGFITNTDARKISFEESLKFEKIHLETYKKFGYECVIIPMASVDERANHILRLSWH